MVTGGSGVEIRPEDNLLAGIGWAHGTIQPSQAAEKREYVRDIWPELVPFTEEKSWTIIPGDVAPPEIALLAFAGKVQHLPMRPIDALWLAARAELQVNGSVRLSILVNEVPGEVDCGIDLSESAELLSAPLAASHIGMLRDILPMLESALHSNLRPLSLAARCLLWERLGGPCQGSSLIARMTPELSSSRLLRASSNLYLDDKKPAENVIDAAGNMLRLLSGTSSGIPKLSSLAEALQELQGRRRPQWTSKRLGSWTVGVRPWKDGQHVGIILRRWGGQHKAWASAMSCWKR